MLTLAPCRSLQGSSFSLTFPPPLPPPPKSADCQRMCCNSGAHTAEGPGKDCSQRRHPHACCWGFQQCSRKCSSLTPGQSHCGEQSPSMFKAYLQLVQQQCIPERDVTLPAECLCISDSMLGSISNALAPQTFLVAQDIRRR